jgi:hypothetical protein
MSFRFLNFQIFSLLCFPVMFVLSITVVCGCCLARNTFLILEQCMRHRLTPAENSLQIYIVT